MTLERISEQRCFGGIQGRYRHASSECSGTMSFSVYQPPQAAQREVPVLFFLCGLTCNDETFMAKGGAQRLASELGLMLVAPDCSPRDTGIAGATGDWEFGEGAGFYVDADQKLYEKHFRMYSYVTRELPGLIERNLPGDLSRSGIFGHSMGGHGALTIALKNPDRYRSVSAFSPIVAPSRVAWGENAFSRYLGNNRKSWADYDACELLKRGTFPGTILIDQGSADKFLADQLQPELFEQACKRNKQALKLRMHEGYDHSYWFVSSFMEDHLRHHAEALTG
jgi:S-formylglutathione hydrolase